MVSKLDFGTRDLTTWNVNPILGTADAMNITDKPLGADAGAVQAGATAPVSATEMNAEAQAAARLLKALAHEGRLMILCHLSSGEKTVGELEVLLNTRQATVSQQLARLRLEGLVTFRREGKAVYYSIDDPKAERVVATVYDLFCKSRDC